MSPPGRNTPLVITEGPDSLFPTASFFVGRAKTLYGTALLVTFSHVNGPLEVPNHAQAVPTPVPPSG